MSSCEQQYNLTLGLFWGLVFPILLLLIFYLIYKCIVVKYPSKSFWDGFKYQLNPRTFS